MTSSLPQHKRYDLIADGFAQQRAKNLREKKYLDRIIETIGKGAKVLDCGCGTGQPMAEYLAGHGLGVTGLDGSAALLEKFRHHLPDATAIEGDMTTIPLDETFSAVIAWDSFFHLPQDAQKTMFARFKAWLEPGGLLLLTTGPEDGTAEGEMFGHHFTYVSFSEDGYRALMDAHDFDVILHECDQPAEGLHIVWLAEKRG